MSIETGRVQGSVRESAPWLPWTAAALGATLLHLLIDYHIGLYGETSETMSPAQAAGAAGQATLFAWWLAAAVAAVRSADALSALFWLVVVEAALINGAVAFLAAPPPSSAFPYQDIAHAGALVLGVVAALRIRRHRTVLGPPEGRFWLLTTVAVLVGVSVIGIALFLSQGLPNAG